MRSEREGLTPRHSIKNGRKVSFLQKPKTANQIEQWTDYSEPRSSKYDYRLKENTKYAGTMWVTFHLLLVSAHIALLTPIIVLRAWSFSVILLLFVLIDCRRVLQKYKLTNSFFFFKEKGGGGGFASFPLIILEILHHLYRPTTTSLGQLFSLSGKIKRFRKHKMNKSSIEKLFTRRLSIYSQRPYTIISNGLRALLAYF